MSAAIKFTDLAAELEPAEKINLNDAPKKGLEVIIEVAGPKEVESKTIQLSLDQRGLIKLSFKEGGQLPRLLAGRFTNIEEVKTALVVWQERRAKEFKLDENISHPHAIDNGKVLSELVDKSIQETPPAFDQPEVEDAGTKGFVDLDEE